MKLQDRSEYDFVVAAPESSETRRSGVGREYAERVRCRDLNGGDVGELEGRVKGLHSRQQMRDEVLVRRGEDFVPHGDSVDLGARIKRENVVGHPGLRRGELGDGGNIAVSDGNGDGDAGVGEGAEDVRVGVEDLDAVDGGFGLEERGDLGWRREVIGDGAVVDADGDGGGEDDVGGGEKEEEEELGRYPS